MTSETERRLHRCRRCSYPPILREEPDGWYAICRGGCARVGPGQTAEEAGKGWNDRYERFHKLPGGES